MQISLKLIVPLFIFSACGKLKYTAEETMPGIYDKPISFTLDTIKGYSINPITGDSIKPLINSLGDTIQTGVSLLLKASMADAGKITRPAISKYFIEQEKLAGTNIHPVQGKPQTVAGDTIDFKNNLDIKNVSNVINVTGQIKPLHEPPPVKTLPLRFKDGATTNIQYLQVEQGLSYPFVHSILIDKKGYLWFGLDGNGLCKYDGIRITNYTQKDGLPNNNITSLLEDSSGNLWIGSDGGLCVYDGKNMMLYSKKNGFPGNVVNTLYKDKYGNIWISGNEIGNIRYDGKKFYESVNIAKLPADIAYLFFTDSRGNEWFRTKTGLAKFDGTHFINFPFNKIGINGGIYKIIEDSKGFIWVATDFNGVYKYDGEKFIHYTDREGMSANSIMSLTNDKNGNIWIGTRYNGINKFNGNQFTNYGIAEGLTSNAISQLVEDGKGNIWCGTQGGGVNKLHDEGFKEIVQMGQLGNSRVRPVIKDAQGDLWLGTETGNTFKYDGKNISHYIIDDVIPHYGLRSILADKKNNLWFGYTDDGGLFKYDGKQFLHYTAASGLQAGRIMSIAEDRNGVIWLGAFNGGINKLEGNTFSYYSEKEKLSSKNIFSILQDKKGNLWFGTDGGGVIKYDGEKFITYSGREGFFGKAVTEITEDEEGNLWMATLGAGVCKFDGKSFTYYTQKQGLSYNDVWSLKEDSAGQFWAGTDKGLSVLIPQKDSLHQTKNNYSLYSFGLQDGLKATDFNLHSVCIDNNNRIWWGTSKALITRDLNTPYIASSPQTLTLQHIDINGKFYDFKSITDSNNKKISFTDVKPFTNYPQNLVLHYNQNHITFYFSAIDWAAPDKIKYSYRLVGLDDKWSNPSEEPQADYRNLGYGNYELQLKAIGQSQVWTEPFIYSFTITPAWWQTLWFKILVVLLSMVLALFISWQVYLARLRKQKVQLEKQLAVQMERQRISSEMHDDIGAGLSGVRLLTEMTKHKLKETTANSDIDRIYDSVGEISAKMKEVIWSLNTENDSLSSLIAYLQKQARQMMEHYPGKFTISLPEIIPDTKISGEVRRQVYLSVKEALHNIIKHSGANDVWMDIKCSDKLYITIADNGKGMDTNEDSPGGNGLKNMRKRMEQLKGKFFIKNGNGVTLTFEIPFNSTL
ncbi:MAG: hypothetical protein HYX40_01550 [Sphingobacteriales bacterium]|nr:hypothetical protein [Sphingobacteriales bacterium]